MPVGNTEWNGVPYVLYKFVFIGSGSGLDDLSEQARLEAGPLAARVVEEQETSRGR